MMVSQSIHHKEDTFADIKGYCDLLDDMVKLTLRKKRQWEIKYFIVQKSNKLLIL